MSKLIVVLGSAAGVIALAAGLLACLREPGGPDPAPWEALEGRVAALERDTAEKLAAIERRIDGLASQGPSRAPAEQDPAASAAAETSGLEEKLAILAARVEELAGTVKAPASDPLGQGRSYVTSENPDLRREGMKMLRPFAGKDAQTREMVRGLLSDPDPQIRAESIRTLRDAGDREAIARFIDLLADADPKVREEAAAALGDLHAQEAAPALASAAQDPDPNVREQALLSLARLGDLSAAERIRAVGWEGRPDLPLRLGIALRDQGDDRTYREEVDRLLQVANADPDESSRLRAIKLINRYAPKEARRIVPFAPGGEDPQIQGEAAMVVPGPKKLK